MEPTWGNQRGEQPRKSAGLDMEAMPEIPWHCRHEKEKGRNRETADDLFSAVLSSHLLRCPGEERTSSIHSSLVKNSQKIIYLKDLKCCWGRAGSWWLLLRAKEQCSAHPHPTPAIKGKGRTKKDWLSMNSQPKEESSLRRHYKQNRAWGSSYFFIRGRILFKWVSSFCLVRNRLSAYILLSFCPRVIIYCCVPGARTVV